MEALAPIIELVNAGGIVAVLVLVLFGFYSGKVMSRASHDESRRDVENAVSAISITLQNKVEECFLPLCDAQKETNETLKELIAQRKASDEKRSSESREMIAHLRDIKGEFNIMNGHGIGD